MEMAIAISSGSAVDGDLENQPITWKAFSALVEATPVSLLTVGEMVNVEGPNRFSAIFAIEEDSANRRIVMDYATWDYRYEAVERAKAGRLLIEANRAAAVHRAVGGAVLDSYAEQGTALIS